jgi:hypothetical protein
MKRIDRFLSERVCEVCEAEYQRERAGFWWPLPAASKEIGENEEGMSDSVEEEELEQDEKEELNAILWRGLIEALRYNDGVAVFDIVDALIHFRPAYFGDRFMKGKPEESEFESAFDNSRKQPEGRRALLKAHYLANSTWICDQGW